MELRNRRGRRGWTVVGTPFGGGIFGGGMRRGGYRRGYGSYGPGYGSRYGPGPGGGCLRDACLLETGCCLAEGLDGNCLLLLLLALPRLTGQLLRPGPARRQGRTAVLLALVDDYQRTVSSARGPCCRFTPSCSRYAAEALRSYGAGRGSWLALRRLLRCRPGGRAGSDPVPS